MAVFGYSICRQTQMYPNVILSHTKSAVIRIVFIYIYIYVMPIHRVICYIHVIHTLISAYLYISQLPRRETKLQGQGWPAKSHWEPGPVCPRGDRQAPLKNVVLRVTAEKRCTELASDYMYDTYMWIFIYIYIYVDSYVLAFLLGLIMMN